jgi:hypothetical protein
MILICRFRRSLATAQTNRFALRLARNSAKTGHILRLAGVCANGTLVVLAGPPVLWEPVLKPWAVSYTGEKEATSPILVSTMTSLRTLSDTMLLIVPGN